MKKIYFKILSLNTSEHVGVSKKPTSSIVLVTDKGVLDDAHFAKNIDRQVSFLAFEDIEIENKKIKDKNITLKPGDFAENITTYGIELNSLKIGSIIYIGDAILKVSKIGKECHSSCNIRSILGDCIMPNKGIFASVVKGGVVTNEDSCYCSF